MLVGRRNLFEALIASFSVAVEKNGDRDQRSGLLLYNLRKQQGGQCVFHYRAPTCRLAPKPLLRQNARRWPSCEKYFRLKIAREFVKNISLIKLYSLFSIMTNTQISIPIHSSWDRVHVTDFVSLFQQLALQQKQNFYIFFYLTKILRVLKKDKSTRDTPW